MKIQDVDKNFKQEEVALSANNKIFQIPCEPFELYGVYFDEETDRFVRMPTNIAENINESVKILHSNTAGGRLRFSTDSKTITLQVTWPNISLGNKMPISGHSGFLIQEETKGEPQMFKLLCPEFESHKGFTASAKLKGGKLRNYTLWFPSYNDVSSLTILLDPDAEVAAGLPHRDQLPILYYGSSITQGGCASRPDNCYQGHIYRWSNLDFINLGFSAGALGEQEMAEYAATIPCSIFVCDYDHNARSSEHLEKTHYNFYKTYRQKNPTTPIIFMTSPDFYAGDIKRLEAIRSTYTRAKDNGDTNVYFIDGRELLAGQDVAQCTVDGIHPNDLGFYRMAKRLYEVVEPLLQD